WAEVKKARRRLSREQGTIIKDWGGRIPIALVYPNSYYVGMSNLGLHALYSLLNSYSQVVGERAFWEVENRAHRSPALCLESQRPLSDFAVVAFSISYELDYFNVVHILKASGIPLYAADRDERHPLVIAGGPCIIANPLCAQGRHTLPVATDDPALYSELAFVVTQKQLNAKGDQN
ncbi:unnamed protein product, partial [marine sediment metagenome]